MTVAGALAGLGAVLLAAVILATGRSGPPAPAPGHSIADGSVLVAAPDDSIGSTPAIARGAPDRTGPGPASFPSPTAASSPPGTASAASEPNPAAPSPPGTASATPKPASTATPPHPRATATPRPPPTATPKPTSPAPPGNYLLMSRAELLRLPTSGSAWSALKAVADGPLGAADLSDQDNRHGVRTLAVALVFARTGDAAYYATARDAIMSAIGTERVGAHNSILSLGRQLGAYVLAADFIGLAGDDDHRFRSWLDGIRTTKLGGHSRWNQLTATHEDSSNNWGAFAGASRIAASRYLGDTADVSRAALVLRGFLGDRSAWSGFQPIDEASATWACDPAAYTPVNPPCTRSGIDVDGAIVRDVSRGGDLSDPPGEAGLLYTNEALQGLVVQAELLRRAGFDPWQWSDRALLRAAAFLTRGDGWNLASVHNHLPWVFNARYGLELPTRAAGNGRLYGYTDWLYGG